MKIRVILISVSVDWNDGKFFTSSISNEKWKPFSALLLDGVDPKSILKELFSDMVDLHSEWAEFIPLSNEIVGDELNLIYGVIIPIDSRWKAPALIDAGFIPKDTPLRQHLLHAIGKIT